MAGSRGRGRFEGRVAVVTGGAGGLGRALCRGFAAEGAAVAIVDLDADAVSGVADELSTSAGAQAEGVAADVREPAAVRAAVDRVAERFGRLDVLVNGAGGSLNTPKDLADIGPEDYDLVLDVNLRGAFLFCQHAVDLLAADGGGAIVNISSIGGRSASPVTGVPYAAAKAGLLGLTRRLAREVGPRGVRVNALAPGLFLSGPRMEGMWQAMTDAEQREVLGAIPLRRMPDLDEAVDPVLFLAGDEASYITGAVLDVNGGRLMV